MSWIKDNKFVAALGCGTLVGSGLLYLAVNKGGERYAQAKEAFDAAVTEVASFEKLPLYPSPENLNGKIKALDEYRNATETLQAAFGDLRPKELKMISPQDFTNRLKAVNIEVRKAFDDSRTKVPSQFFCGFENYQTNLARGNATAILDYQLECVRNLMLALAKSGVSEINNLSRPKLQEENGSEYKPQNHEVVRPLPLEITFSGPEKTARAFLSEISKQGNPYVVIRLLRVSNEKKNPPRVGDAKFEPISPKPGAIDELFGTATGFEVLNEAKPGEPKPGEPKPGEPKPGEPKPGEPKPGEATPGEPKPGEATPGEANPVAAADEAPADTSRTLSQVLGNEEIQVFLRLDLMQFLPAKKLP